VGLFDKVLGEAAAADRLTVAEGMAGVALCACAADGVVSEEEASELASDLGRMSLYADATEREVDRIFEKLLAIVRQRGVDELLARSAAAVSAELRPTAFAIATDLLMADGTVRAEERAFLERIQKTLQVGDDLALKIVEVIAIKNRG
jgi:tellurite resistance protein